MNTPPNLCYTLALDRPGQDVHHRMARLLVTSLLRTGWHGRVTVFRNGALPVLPGGHPSVNEIAINVGVGDIWHKTVSWKFRLRGHLELGDVEKVLFLDCDCIALRSLNHIMLGRWDIYTATEPGRIVETPFNGYLTDEEMTALKTRPGLNSGTMGIRANHYREVMEEWEQIEAKDQIRPSKYRNQHSWNRLILDTKLRHRSFAAGEVQYPFLHRAVYPNYRRATLIHAADRSPEEKFSLLFGLWMEAFGSGRFEELVVP